MERMETQATSTEEALRTLLERTAAQQASLEALAASVAELRDGQRLMQAAITSLQVDVAGIKGTMTHYATHAEVESVRAELYKALEAQTWRILVFMTAVCSGLTAAVYFIARNVH
jgi:chromosome segregation ATPase